MRDKIVFFMLWKSKFYNWHSLFFWNLRAQCANGAMELKKFRGFYEFFYVSL